MSRRLIDRHECRGHVFVDGRFFFRHVGRSPSRDFQEGIGFIGCRFNAAARRETDRYPLNIGLISVDGDTLYGVIEISSREELLPFASASFHPFLPLFLRFAR